MSAATGSFFSALLLLACGCTRSELLTDGPGSRGAELRQVHTLPPLPGEALERKFRHASEPHGYRDSALGISVETERVNDPAIWKPLMKKDVVIHEEGVDKVLELCHVVVVWSASEGEHDSCNCLLAQKSCATPASLVTPDPLPRAAGASHLPLGTSTSLYLGKPILLGLPLRLG